jgi:vancomycin resistance protein YoaR
VRAAGAPTVRSSVPTSAAGALDSGTIDARRTSRRPGTKARSRRGSSSGITFGPVSFGLGAAFAVGVFAALVLAAFVAIGLSQAYDGKIMAGVHVGSLDLGGLTRDEAITQINTAFSSLGEGTVTVATPGGTGTISFKDAGRGPDAAAMADAAMSIGRGQNPLSSAVSALHALAGGSEIPLIVKVDPTSLETKLHVLTGSSMAPPTDAKVTVSGTSFKVMPSATGKGINETAIANKIIDALIKADAPSNLTVDGSFQTVQPSVNDSAAQAAIAAAGKMVVDVNVTNGTKSWTIPAATVRTWLMFGVRTDGTFGPVVNPDLVTAWVTALGPSVNVNPGDPKIIKNSAGNPTGLTNSTAGIALNVGETTQALEVYLDSLGSGSGAGSSTIAVVTDAVEPKINDSKLTGFTIIGAQAVTFFPGVSNGGGANIIVPAQILNDQIIQPGEHFSFLQRVGPIDAAHGFKPGGVILHGKSDHTGAMGGGICSASTTVFNAAITAGLQVDERHAHFYWISRYPLGLDATVYSNGSTTWDMRFTNDTPNPIVIKAYVSGGRTQKQIKVQFWSLPDGRTTKFSTPVVTNVVNAVTGTQYVASLPGGAKVNQPEYATPGKTVFRTRTVTDKTGAVIHYDEFHSTYTKVDGIVQIVGTPKPPATPTPKSTPKPPPTPAPPTPALIVAPFGLPLLFGLRRKLHR